jgi:hypothetical protein
MIPDHIEFVFEEIFKGLSLRFLPETFTEQTNIKKHRNQFIFLVYFIKSS